MAACRTLLGIAVAAGVLRFVRTDLRLSLTLGAHVDLTVKGSSSGRKGGIRYFLYFWNDVAVEAKQFTAET